MNRKYAVIFEQAETNWAAYVPDLPARVCDHWKDFGGN